MTQLSGGTSLAAMTIIIKFLPHTTSGNRELLDRWIVHNRGGHLVGTVVGVNAEEVKRYVAQAKIGG